LQNPKEVKIHSILSAYLVSLQSRVNRVFNPPPDPKENIRFSKHYKQRDNRMKIRHLWLL